jgi:hypothetical protein
VKFREPNKNMMSFKQENCPNRICTDVWVPLDHMLGIRKQNTYNYCLKHKAECIQSHDSNKQFCLNCGLGVENGFYCNLCTFIKNRDIFPSNQNLKLCLFLDFDRNKLKDLYGTHLHILDIDKTIEWLNTYNPKKKTTLVYNRFWHILPSPGYHLVYDFKELWNSYIKTYE